MVKITVKYFALVRDVTKTKENVLEVGDNATIHNVIANLCVSGAGATPMTLNIEAAVAASAHLSCFSTPSDRGHNSDDVAVLNC